MTQMKTTEAAPFQSGDRSPAGALPGAAPDPQPHPDPAPDSPRGPQPTPGTPDRGNEPSPVPPILDPGDTRNPNDPAIIREPALLPIGDPSGMA